MANHNKVEYDSTDFQTSISYYIHTIEEVYKSLEEKQRTNDDPSYSLSLQILRQILQQMKSLIDRRLSYNALEQLLSSESLIFPKSGQESSSAVFSTPFKIYGSMKECDQNNLIPEEETALQVQREVDENMKKPEFLIDNTPPPPPWKPKK